MQGDDAEVLVPALQVVDLDRRHLRVGAPEVVAAEQEVEIEPDHDLEQAALACLVDLVEGLVEGDQARAVRRRGVVDGRSRGEQRQVQQDLPLAPGADLLAPARERLQLSVGHPHLQLEAEPGPVVEGPCQQSLERFLGLALPGPLDALEEEADELLPLGLGEQGWRLAQK